MVQVLSIGEYEDEITGNSTWINGDWDGDGEFTSSDLVSALTLDFGRTLRAVVVSMIGFWCIVLGFVVRRQHKPTNVDTLFMKYGIWFVLIITAEDSKASKNGRAERFGTGSDTLAHTEDER